MDHLEEEEVAQRAGTEITKTQSASKAAIKQNVFDENFSGAAKEFKYKNDFELNISSAGRHHKGDSSAGEEKQGKANQETKKENLVLSYKDSTYSRREEAPLVVAESPLEWEDWTTNSDESSTISVLQSDAVKTFHVSESFDFIKAQKLEKKEDKTEKEIITSHSKFRPPEDPIISRHLQVGPVAPEVARETFDTDSDSSTLRELSGKKKIQTNGGQERYEGGRSYRRDLSPHTSQDRREVSPSFRSRDSSATRFVAIDAYLGIKDKDAAADKKEQKRDTTFSYRNKTSSDSTLGESPRDNCSSLEHNKNMQRKTEEADIKEDLCSSLLSIKSREEVSAEGKKYSESDLSGLKKLTTVDGVQTKERGSLNEVDSIKYENSLSKHKYGFTDDTKSYYKSKQLLSENAEVLKSSYQSSVSSPAQHRPEELPGFLAKTPHLTAEQGQQERDLHFESEFPTFSAYLRRTYGQTYSYRTRENSEDNQDHYRTKTEETSTLGVSIKEAEGKRKIKENELLESKSSKEDYQFPDCVPGKKESGHKVVEHNSRKSNYQQGGKTDLPADTSKACEANNFLSRSRESVFETSGSAPAYGEVGSGATKQLSKTSSAGRGKGNKVDQREASPTIDLLQRSFESLQSALNNKDLDMMEREVRRMSPSPERFNEERRSDSSHSRSRSRTRKRTVQSQAKSRDSSQKMRLKEMAPTYYEARHGQGHDQPPASQVQTASPSLSEIEVIYKGAEPENYNLNTKYIERYPMDFNDEDISVMKKFIHHKKDELPEMFYMDVETFKKYYVQNRVMEMKRESSNSRRSSLSSMHEIDTLEREASLPRDSRGEKEVHHQHGPHQSRSMTAGQAGLSASNIGVSHSPIDYGGSPHKRSVAVQMQVRGDMIDLHELREFM